jgi:ornithine--oxo-acid transaminase
MLRRSFALVARANPARACAEVDGWLKNTTSKSALNNEKSFSAHNYRPVPVVFSKASGCKVTDPEGKTYIDCLSGYGAVSHGHLHPTVVKTAIEQLKKCTLSSRAFHSKNFGVYAKFITRFFGYERVLPMNTGAEGVETAMKLARKWGYMIKGIPKDQAIIVGCNNCFHGRTFGAISLSDDPDSYGNYGPLLPGLMRVDFGNAEQLAKVFEKHGKNICAFIAEPLQGEAGVIIPPKGFFKEVRRLCTKHRILFIADEVQSGIGRSGKMLAIEHEKVRPDVVVMAKALGAGILPVAAVLADTAVMKVIEPGTHGSTFGGNPLANAVAIASLQVMHRERLPQRSLAMGKLLLAKLEELKQKNPDVIKEVRGRGLFAAIEFKHDFVHGEAAMKYSKILAKHGILAKGTHGHTLRISPPLIIDEKVIDAIAVALERGLVDLRALTMDSAGHWH